MSHPDSASIFNRNSCRSCYFAVFGYSAVSEEGKGKGKVTLFKHGISIRCTFTLKYRKTNFLTNLNLR